MVISELGTCQWLNIWELDGKEIKFEDPAWNKQIHSTVLDEVCTVLGLSMPCSMELDKLLVHEAGSRSVVNSEDLLTKTNVICLNT